MENLVYESTPSRTATIKTGLYFVIFFILLMVVLSPFDFVRLRGFKVYKLESWIGLIFILSIFFYGFVSYYALKKIEIIMSSKVIRMSYRNLLRKEKEDEISFEEMRYKFQKNIFTSNPDKWRLTILKQDKEILVLKDCENGFETHTINQLVADLE